jgi:hypothetical protein
MRGVDAPLVLTGPKYTTITCSWISDSAFLLSPTEQCETIDPNDLPTEIGRTYNLTFNRYYLPTPPVGGIYIVNNGTAPAQWTIEIDASVINPIITVGSTVMNFSQNGGISLVTGQTLNISTVDRTILLNNDPTLSRYDRVNFQDWTWDDLALQPGSNLVRLQGTGFTSTTRLTICWQDTYL